MSRGCDRHFKQHVQVRKENTIQRNLMWFVVLRFYYFIYLAIVPAQKQESSQGNHSQMVGPPKPQRRNKTVGEYYIIDTDASMDVCHLINEFDLMNYFNDNFFVPYARLFCDSSRSQMIS